MGVEMAAIGVCAGHLLALGWEGSAWPLPALAVALGAWWALARPRRRWAGALAIAILGATVGLLRTRPVVADEPPAGDIGAWHVSRPLTVVGRITDGPTWRGDRTLLVLEAGQVLEHGRVVPVRGRVRIGVRGRLRRIRLGDRVRFTSHIRPPRSFANPGSFDLAAYLARRGIHATAFLSDAGALTRIAPRRVGYAVWLGRWRAHIRGAIRSATRPPARGVLVALVLGEEQGIDDALRRAFSRAGVVHILSVSGLHVGLVGLGVATLVALVLGRSERVLLATDVRQASLLAALPAVALYAALAGFQLPTLRSVLMLAAVVVAGLLGRRVRPVRALALAALGLGVVTPGAALDAGFQLSFMSVLALVLGAGTAPAAVRGLARGFEWARVALRASAVATVATAPLTAFHFHQVSLVGVLANPIVIPLFGSLVVALAMLGAAATLVSPVVAVPLFHLAGLALVPGIWLVERLGSLPWAAVDVPMPDGLGLAIVYMGLAGLALLPRPLGRRLVVIACAAAVADVGWSTAIRHSRPALRVTFLDVGQGDAAVVELADGRALVVDGGGLPGGALDTGAIVVEPFLLTRWRVYVDAIAMSHAHPDHFGGLVSLLDHGWAREFWWNGQEGNGEWWDRLADVLRREPVPPRILRAGDVVLPGPISVLHPAPGALGGSLNDGSLTMGVIAPGGARVLLTGDIEEAAERELLAAGRSLESVVLKVPHHGSRTSSTDAFLDAVRPSLAVISVGLDNRYGLPSRAIEARYRARGICALRTDRCGAITVELTPASLRAWSERAACACPESASRGCAVERP